MPKIIDTKAKILDAAIFYFAKKGYSQATLQQIATQANIKAPSIYKHYSSKEEILNDIFEYFMIHYNQNRMPTDKVVEAVQDKPVSAVVPMLFYTYGSDAERLTKIARIILDLRLENPKAHSLFRKLFFDEPTDYICSIFDQLIADGRMKAFDYKPFIFQVISFAYTELGLASAAIKPKVELERLHKEAVTFLTEVFELLTK